MRYILSGIFCSVNFVRYILSGLFYPGTSGPVYIVRYVLSGYVSSGWILSGLFFQ